MNLGIYPDGPLVRGRRRDAGRHDLGLDCRRNLLVRYGSLKQKDPWKDRKPILHRALPGHQEPSFTRIPGRERRYAL